MAMEDVWEPHKDTNSDELSTGRTNTWSVAVSSLFPPTGPSEEMVVVRVAGIVESVSGKQ